MPSNWDGGNIQIAPLTYSGASTSNETIWTDGIDPVDTWFKISAQLNISLDITGWVGITGSSVATAGRYIYIDALQIEESDTFTSYCDGSLQGCKWNGIPNASTSTRNVFESSGGEILNFEDDLSLHISDESGSGMLPVKNHSSPLRS